jgi:CubicO group peptidase (beta-lactamase class C family)
MFAMSVLITTPEELGFNSKRLERIAPAMQNYVDTRGFSGISTMISRRGKIVYSNEVGFQDREKQIPLTSDTIFRIYSMTKPIICTALMLLHEEGKFDLIEPVAKYLPAFGKVKVYTGPNTLEAELQRPILIGDLFTHTSGLTYSFLVDSPVCDMYLKAGILSDATSSLEQVINELARLPLAYQPGSVWHYGMSIDVLAHLIEVLSGQSLQTFLSERLFGPLGMADTGFQVPEHKLQRVAAMYGGPDIVNHTVIQMFEAWATGDNKRRDSVEQTYPTNQANFARGGHGLFSTTSDYMRFAMMLQQGGKLDGERLLSRKTIELMHSNHLPATLLPFRINGLPRLGYGFGLGSRVLQDPAATGLPGSVGEFGWAGAAQTYFWVDPREEIVGVFMTQYMMGFDLAERTLQILTYQALMD